MSYTVDYGGLDPVAKHNQAISDVREFMGDERFERCTAQLKEMALSLDQFTLYAGLAGVKGYPAKAWYNYCYYCYGL